MCGGLGQRTPWAILMGLEGPYTTSTGKGRNVADPVRVAALQWGEDGRPYSPEFQDSYFSHAGGLQETRHVFLAGNQLPARWRQRPLFTIAETGFGTGLNFLAAWDLWQQTALPRARLHYLSLEKFPLSPGDQSRALSLWPELGSLAQQLLARVPWPTPGFHRIHLEGGRVLLTLLFGDMREVLPQMDPSELVDAWFLDGFAPQKNPEMWGAPLYEQLRRLTREDGTVATYTAAGIVRRGLESAGFRVERVPGHGPKRDMLVGRRQSAMSRQAAKEDRHAVIIGAGLAGTASAHGLLKRDWKVTLVERHEGLAREASGNIAGIIMPVVTAYPSIRERFYCEGFQFTLRRLRDLEPGQDSLAWSECGVLELAVDARRQKRWLKTREVPRLPAELVQAVDASRAGALCGFKIELDAFYYPAGAWVHPPDLCRAMVNEPGLNLLFCREVLQLQRQEHCWCLLDGDGNEIARSSVVIIANARDSARFAQSSWLPLRSIRGQLTYLPESTRSRRLKMVVCYGGYILPATHGIHCAGATYDVDEENPELESEGQRQNLAKLQERFPDFFATLEPQPAEGYPGQVGFRSASPDRLPIVGALPDSPGLFLNLGHGSRGLVSCPIAGELLACQLQQEPLPLEQDLVAALSSERFLCR